MKPLAGEYCSSEDGSSSDCDDEISVGCPSPQPPPPTASDTVMFSDSNVCPSSQKMNVAKDKDVSPSSPPPPSPACAVMSVKNSPATTTTTGVRSFSILDILNHRPASKNCTSATSPSPVTSNVGAGGGKMSTNRRRNTSSSSTTSSSSQCGNGAQQNSSSGAQHHGCLDSPTKPIIRPWDAYQLNLMTSPHLTAAAAGFLTPGNARCLAAAFNQHPSAFHPSPFNVLQQHHHHHHHHNAAAAAAALAAHGLAPPPPPPPPSSNMASAAATAFHPFHRTALTSVGINLNVGLSPASHRASSASPYSNSSDVHDTDMDADADEDVSTTSGSVSAGSPLLPLVSMSREKALLTSGSSMKNVAANNNNHKKSANDNGGTPLDALFQMTSKTFDGGVNPGPDSSGEF